MRAIALIWSCLSFLLVTGMASAQQQPATPGNARLFFATGTVGLGDCGGDLCRPSHADTGPLPGLGAGVYIRPIPYFAGGLTLDFGWMSADDENEGREDEGARSFLTGLAIRGIVPLGMVEPWAGLGFGYAWWGYYWSTDKKDESLTVDGTAFSFSLGVDVRVAPDWWVGGTFRYAATSWGDRCREKLEMDGTIKLECRPVDSLMPEERNELPDSLWYLGATVRFDFG